MSESATFVSREFSIAAIGVSDDLFRRLFDKSPAQVALLDFTGRILQTNLSWRRFGRENGQDDSYDCVDQNYLSICSAAAAAGNADAQRACVGLLQVMHLQRRKFTMVYPCHSPTERKWFRLWIQPQTPELPVIVVAHYDLGNKPVLTRDGCSDFSANPAERARYDA
jgi:hypothetical protein